ncbi:hypothetical protein HUJ04_004299 [Dendroctonus ponderosae]|nr:hypothetical protein HUJ04_004299 [Dendroctonus ponderosae]
MNKLNQSFNRTENPCNVQKHHRNVHYHNQTRHNAHPQVDKTEQPHEEHDVDGIPHVEHKEEDKEPDDDDENIHRVHDGSTAPDGDNPDKGRRSNENILFGRSLWKVAADADTNARKI